MIGVGEMVASDGGGEDIPSIEHTKGGPPREIRGSGGTAGSDGTEDIGEDKVAEIPAGRKVAIVLTCSGKVGWH